MEMRSSTVPLKSEEEECLTSLIPQLRKRDSELHLWSVRRLSRLNMKFARPSNVTQQQSTQPPEEGPVKDMFDLFTDVNFDLFDFTKLLFSDFVTQGSTIARSLGMQPGIAVRM
jgi:hypothetical protein